MKRKSAIRLLLLCFTALFILSCNMVPDVVRNIFASATPTATNTPPSTPTPTNTPTPTATPLPAVNLNTCAYKRYCPEAHHISDYIETDVRAGEVYYVDIPHDLPVSFHVGWIAAMYDIMDQNKPHLHWIFELDGQDYYSEDFTVEDLTYNSDCTIWPSIYTGVKTSGWVLGEHHKVVIGFTLDEAVNDGWDDYPAGYSALYTYIVNPVLMPTNTPTATATETPLPTNTPKPRPTSVPYTPTPACKVNSVIHIENDTGGYITLYLSGPAKFTFNIPAGKMDIPVCSGQYSYTGYGCGGSSLNGTMKAGDTVNFYCR